MNKLITQDGFVFIHISLILHIKLPKMYYSNICLGGQHMLKFTKVKDYVQFIATILTLLTVVTTNLSTFNKWLFGENNTDLLILGSFLKPAYGFFNKDSPDKSVYPMFEIKNLNDKNIILTGMKVKIYGQKNMQSPSGLFGENVLSADLNKNDPIIIEPGKSVFIIHNKGINLSKLSDFFEQKKVQNLFFTEYSYGLHTINDLSWINLLNQEFKNQYGANSQIKVTLFTGNKRPIRRFSCKFSEGVDPLSHNGKFKHTVFLGELLALKQKSQIRQTNINK